MESVKVITNNNEKLIRSFFNFHFRYVRMILLALGAVGLVFGLACCCMSKIASGILLLIIAVFFITYGLTIVAVETAKNKRYAYSEDEFVFNKENFHLISRLVGEEVVNQTIKYSDIHSLKETRELMFVYLTKNNALILEKKNITKEEYNFIINNITKSLITK